MKRAIAVMAAVLCALACLAPGAFAQVKPSPTPKPGTIGSLTSKTAILVNLSDDDEILFTRGGRVHRAPASLTKIVTALVVRDEYRLDDVVTADSHVLQTGGSDLGLEPGMRETVIDLLYALLLPSTNDTAMDLAAHDPLGYEHFIALMNAKARALGAYDSQFRNPHGLDMIGHYSSARDMAIFGRAVLADPVLAKIVQTKHFTIPWKGSTKTVTNHNKLLFQDNRVIGMKTGFTAQAGRNLISAAKTEAGTMLTVVMGSNNHYADTETLFTYGRAVAERTSSGGGQSAGFGQLPQPPSAPNDVFATSAVPTTSDPRDDIRWSVLMIALALVTAFSLVRNRQRAPVAPGMNAWLASLQADERRRRR